MANLTRIAALMLSAAIVSCLGFAPPASAIPAPVINPAVDIAPPDGDPAPALPMKQNTVCATSAVLADSQFGTIPASGAFGVSELHDFARGDGQVVAVIDSGVQPVTRLPRLRGGGDYIMSGDGLSDCDHHGTLIAGLVAGHQARRMDSLGSHPARRSSPSGRPVRLSPRTNGPRDTAKPIARQPT